MLRVLLVDDDSRIRATLGAALNEAGYSVTTAASGTEALGVLASANADVVLTDVRMPGMGGLELLKLLRERSANTDVVLMTAFDDMATVVTAMREGAAEFTVKPIDLDSLIRILARLEADRAIREEYVIGDSARIDLDGLIGRDPQMLTVYKRIGQAAANRATVLIRGESGTGKEVVARSIHDSSIAKSNPFVAVNCAALPQGLLESELFGHVRGAFTGAVASRRGRLAYAQSGTIFLDEIGDTTPEFQAKLLRVLQTREYNAVGSDQVERFHARVIAATHRPLESMVRDGSFREDLFYRLCVFEIRLPALRERIGDLRDIAQHVLRRAADAAGLPTPVIADDAYTRMIDHPWPGNVRELENVLTRALFTSSAGVLHAADLMMATSAERDDRDGTSLPRSLAEIEREHIMRVLAYAKGNKSYAAQILRIPRARLSRLIQKFGLD